MCKPLFLSRLAVWVGAVLCASSGWAEDVLTLYRHALQHNAELATTQAEQVAVREFLPQARARYMPTVDLNASVTQNRVGVDRAGSQTAYQYANTTMGLNYTQPLYDKQLGGQLQQAGARVDEGEAKLEDARQSLALKLVETYFEALLLQDNVRVTAEKKRAIRAQSDQARRMFGSGLGTVTDVREAQARLESADAEEIGDRNTQQVRLHDLQVLAGILPTALKPLGMKLENPLGAERLEQWLAKAEAQNPELLMLKARVAGSERSVEVARAGHYPRLDLVGGLNWTSDPSYSDVGTDLTSAELGVRLKVPLSQGGLVDSRIAQSRALLERARSDLEAGRRRIAQQVRAEYLNVVSGLVKASALDQAVQSHLLALDAMEKGFKAGVRTNVEILNEQQLLYAAKRDWNKARYDVLLSRMRLMRAAGELNEVALALVNSWLVEPDPLAEGASEQPTVAEVRPARVEPVPSLHPLVTPSETANAPDAVRAGVEEQPSMVIEVVERPAPAGALASVDATTPSVPVLKSAEGAANGAEGAAVKGPGKAESAPAVGHYLQLGLFRVRAGAEQVMQQAQHAAGKGVEVRIEQTGTLNRVLAGPFETHSQRLDVQSRLHQALGFRPIPFDGPALR